MKTSQLKFVLIFQIFVVAFLFGSHLLLNQATESLVGSLDTQTARQAIISTLLSPIKIILMGPLLPFIEFLRQDPDTPPSFYLLGFVFYWTILALFVHYLIHKLKQAYHINN